MKPCDRSDGFDLFPRISPDARITVRVSGLALFFARTQWRPSDLGRELDLLGAVLRGRATDVAAALLPGLLWAALVLEPLPELLTGFAWP